MSYRAQVILHSRSVAGSDLMTISMSYPRMVHAEIMTHRALSRNASSSRAIPIERMLTWVETDPAMPVVWGSNRPGMQAGDAVSPEVEARAKEIWLRARDNAANSVRELEELGIHKQLSNRIIEPWGHINVVATGSRYAWINLFALRCNPAAQPEFQAIAVRAARAYRDSTPQILEPGRWHLPFISPAEKARLSETNAVKVSTARCARTSFLDFDGKVSKISNDLALHDRLEGNGHWSPFENPARASADPKVRSGNLVGFDQYRQLLDVSVHAEFDWSILDTFPEEWTPEPALFSGIAA